jgi:uncharacterized membrane protein
MSFLAIELVAFVVAALIFREAWKQGVHQFVLFHVAMAFGFAIEVFFVSVYEGYSYGDFLFDIVIQGHNVPLWVALGWGTIIWTSMQATDRMGIPWGARPALDGLLAVSLDFGLDPIADALGWWSWSRPGQFFGVPFDNFIGWVLIVGSYSMAVRAGFKLWKPGQMIWRDIAIPVVSLIPSVLFVAGAQIVLEKVYPLIGEPMTFFLLVCVLLAVGLPFALKARTTKPMPWYLLGVPAVYQGLFVVILLAVGLSSEVPELLLVLPLASFASLVAFTHPRRD